MSKEEKEKLVPNLRFKGFTDDWILYKGSEIFEKRSQTKEEKGEYFLDIGLENLISNGGIIVGDTTPRTDATSVFHKNDVLFGRLRPYLNKWWYATHTGLMSGEIWALFPIGNNDSLFLYYLIQSDRFLYYANISSGTRMPRASWNIINSSLYAVPNATEQLKVGRLLQLIDNIITLEHLQKRKLIKLKDAIYEHIFGAAENKVAMFFDTHISKWKIYSLGDVVSKAFKGTMKASDITLGNTEYLDANRLNGGTPLYCNTKFDVSFKDILILWDGSNAGKVYTGFEGVLGSTLKSYRIKEDFDSSYIFQYLKGQEQKIIHSYTTPNIPHVVKDFENVFKIPIPRYKEQVKIGKLLNEYDQLIYKHQENIKYYEQVKKLLLSNMFV